MFTTFSSKPLVGIWYLFAASLVGLDQATKYAIQVLLPLRASIEVTPFFNLVHVLNPGAAFSFLADAGGWQRYLFIGLGLAVSVFLAFALWRGVRGQFETAAYIGLIGGALATRGTLVVDAGCAAALAAGKSLLAVGLVSVEGDFGKGDAVQVTTADGQPVARGLVRYDAADAARIVGVASAGLKAALGYEAGPVVVHADDLTLR